MVLKLLNKVINNLISANLTISTVESITGGLIAAKIVSIPNVSSIFTKGLVTYSNQEKINQGVNKATIDTYGVVSEEVVKEMASLIDTDISISTSGNAGPNVQDKSKLGSVWVCIRVKNEFYTKELSFRGTRKSIINKTYKKILNLLSPLVIKGI